MSQSGRLTAQEYADIYNLYAYYNLSSDTGAPEEYAACFTPDGVMEVAGGRMLVKGRQDLTTYKRNDQAGRGGRYRRHWNGSIYLEKLADGSVRGRCYVPTTAIRGISRSPPAPACMKTPSSSTGGNGSSRAGL